MQVTIRKSFVIGAGVLLIIALAIGATTMVMSSAGLMLGRFIGARFGRIAETLGGAALCGIGTLILWQHLTAG